MRVLILGGGRQGRVIASDLASAADVTVADARPIDLPGVKTIVEDLSDANALGRRMREQDLVVGALPASLGFCAARAAIEARRNYVDVAFYAEDASTLHEDARRAGITIIPDCGLAPGISHLVAGREIARGTPDELHIKVGGVSADPSRPFGYVVTWSVDDLIDEYRRPARIVREGRVTTVPALSGLQRVRIDGVGEMEEFYTDGLRTLLDCGVRELTEKTLRWPGHVESVRPLLEKGSLADELKRRCADGDDLVALRVDVIRGGKTETFTLVDRAREGLSAMSRTTAFSCAAFARWAMEGGLRETGVVPPERIGADERAFGFLTSRLRSHGIRIEA